jgi:eukaryotic-like serine/threonine-protein kinase
MDGTSSSAHDRVGRTLGGKYHLRAVLGLGGTAVVYRATAIDGSTVAVKLLHDYLCRSTEVVRRFTQEGYVGNMLNHRGTVRVLDHGQDDDETVFLVLEMLEGESLEDRRVRLGGRLPIFEVLGYVDQLLAVLEVAHAKSIIHRDIKPSNLFIMNDGTLKVLDFGIARVVDDGGLAGPSVTKTGQMIGTPAFMPPEQALSRPRDVDARTDLWSVGATMFTLLSGEHVHLAESSSEHLVKAATLHARSLARALRGVPENVEGLVAKALAFDKNDRWTSAAEMRAELALVREDPGRGIGTSTSPPPDRSPSSANMPTLIGAPRSDRSDRISDAVMSLTGEHPARRRRRSYFAPLIVASVLALVATAALVLVLLRTPSPAPASVGRAAAAADIPPPPPVDSLPAPAPPPTMESSAPKSEGTSPRPPPSPAASAVKPSAPASPSSSVRKATNKAAPSATFDVYRPY